ncbi:MAG: hypothetical protein ABR924_01725 [Terracidiphilus sp.]|jgi:hypothetical protein
MRREFVLDLPFKGAREYLHSTSIVPALTEVAQERFGPQAWVESLTIRRPFRRAIRASFEPVAASSGSFRVRRGTESIPGWLLETDRPVTRRVASDSSPLSAAAVSGPGFARIQEPVPGFAALEVAVSLMKMVAGRLDPRQCWLCQLNLDTPLTSAFPIEVRIRHELGGRFLVFEIVQDGAAIGSARCILEFADS